MYLRNLWQCTFLSILLFTTCRTSFQIRSTSHNSQYLVFLSMFTNWSDAENCGIIKICSGSILNGLPNQMINYASPEQINYKLNSFS